MLARDGKGNSYIKVSGKKNLFFGVGLAFLVILGFGSFGIVGPGERGIRVTLGETGKDVLGEGPHLKFPFISTIRTMSVRVQKSEDTSDAATKDMQRVRATVALNWTINPESVGNMLREVGTSDVIENNLIAPAVSEALKAATARMTAEEVLTRRIELKKMIDEMLIERLTGYGLVIKDISLVNLDFTNEFNRAVEEKQIAEQEAKRAQYNAQKAKEDAVAEVNIAKGRAEARLVEARAQAEAQRLLKVNLNKDILTLEYLKRWDGKLPQVMTNGNGLLMNLDIQNEERDN